jgi:hypothetical protein
MPVGSLNRSYLANASTLEIKRHLPFKRENRVDNLNLRFLWKVNLHPHSLCSFLSFLLSGSAYLYRNEVSYDVIWCVLGGLALGSWAALDATWWGFLLAAACGVGAPAAEIVLNK